MIDILLATYNGEQFLREQLDSILAQTYTDWQLFVRDDGSTDNTLDILQKYAEMYPQKMTIYKDNLYNLGAMHSFEQLLLKCAHNQYTMFCDQDDVWLPNKIELFVQKMHEVEAQFANLPLVVHGDMIVVDKNLDPIHPSFWQYSHIRPEILDDKLYFLAICNTITGCSCLFNNKAKQYMLPISKQAYMHDAWLGLTTLKNKGKIIPIFEPTMLYRQHNTNTLGAVDYQKVRFDVAFKKKMARQVYHQAKDVVFKNKLEFWFYKVIYFVYRHIRIR
ncbi:MAG: glycosyltransferase family 2 protein [Paludibacteraceae bacterium]